MILYNPLASGVALKVFRAQLGLLQRGDFICE
jgi:hypothetical protein